MARKKYLAKYIKYDKNDILEMDDYDEIPIEFCITYDSLTGEISDGYGKRYIAKKLLKSAFFDIIADWIEGGYNIRPIYFEIILYTPSNTPDYTTIQSVFVTKNDIE